MSNAWGFVEAQVALESIGQLSMRDELAEIVEPIQTTARKLVTQPGYPGDKPGLTPLRDTIGTRVERVGIGVFSAEVRPSGQHGHNVEFGHDGPAPAPAHPYMGPAIEAEFGNVTRRAEDRLASKVQETFLNE